MNRIKLLIVSLFVLTLVGCKADCDNQPDNSTFKSSKWETRTQDWIMTLTFIDENTCGIGSGSLIPGILSYNYTEYKYEHGDGIDLFIYTPLDGGEQMVAYTGNFQDKNNLTLHMKIDDENYEEYKMIRKK